MILPGNSGDQGFFDQGLHNLPWHQHCMDFGSNSVMYNLTDDSSGAMLLRSFKLGSKRLPWKTKYAEAKPLLAGLMD